MAKNRSVQPQAAVQAGQSWHTLDAQIVDLIKAAVDGLGADAGAPGLVRALPADAQRQLFEQRDIYLSCLWTRAAPADASESHSPMPSAFASILANPRRCWRSRGQALPCAVRRAAVVRPVERGCP